MTKNRKKFSLCTLLFTVNITNLRNISEQVIYITHMLKLNYMNQIYGPNCKKPIRIIWYSNETIDFKLEAEKTIGYKETNHSKTNNKMTVHPFKKREENWFNRSLRNPPKSRIRLLRKINKSCINLIFMRGRNIGMTCD